MLIIKAQHIPCLMRLLSAAAVPSSISYETACAVLLHLSTHSGALCSNASSLQALPQLPPRAAFHSTTAARSKRQPQSAARPRLAGLKQLMEQDVKKQELSKGLQKLKQQQQLARQQQQQDSGSHVSGVNPAAASPAGSQQQSAQISWQQQQQQHRALLREQLEALKNPSKLSPQPPKQTSQLQQQPRGSSAGHGKASAEQLLRQHNNKQHQQEQQRQQQRQRPQPQAAALEQHHMDRDSAVLPPLVRHMLMHEQAPQEQQQHHQPSLPQPQPQPQQLLLRTAAHHFDDVSSSSSSSDGSGAAVAASRVGESGQYSNWVAIDTSLVIVTDGYDDFLGVWPDASAWGLEPLLTSYNAEELLDDYADAHQQQQEQQWDAQGAACAAGEAPSVGAASGAAAAAADGGDDYDDCASSSGTSRSSSTSTQEVAQQLLPSSLSAGAGAPAGGSHSLPSAAAAADVAAELESADEFDAAAVTSAAAAADDDDDDAGVVDADASQSVMQDLAYAAEVDGIISADDDDAAAAAAAIDPAVLQLQQLQAAAAAAGRSAVGAPEQWAASPAGSSSSSSQEEQRLRWSVAGLFDAAEAVDGEADDAIADSDEEFWGSTSWLLAAAQDEQQQADGLDPAAAAAAADAAIRASDAAAAAAAATLQPLHWPAHLPLLCAIQSAELQQAQQVHQQQQTEAGSQQQQQQQTQAATLQVDSKPGGNADSNLDSGTGSECVRSSGSASEPTPQPFAWMFARPSPAAAATGAAAQPHGLQYVLQTLHDMQPLGARQFVFQPGPHPPVIAPSVDSSLLQYIQPRAARTEQRQRQQKQHKQQQQQQSQQQPQQQQSQQQVAPAPQPTDGGQQQTWRQFGAELWQAAKDLYGLSDPAASIAANASEQQSARDADVSDWHWDTQRQQQQQQDQLQSAYLKGSNFVLALARQHAYDVQEQPAVARVTAMAAGTCLEPLLWSVLSQERTRLLPGRAGLQTVQGASGAALHRHALWLPDATKGRKQQEPSRQLQRQQRQRQRKHLQQQVQSRSQPAAWAGLLQQQGQAATLSWFEGLLFAAAAAVRHTGQLVMQAVPAATTTGMLQHSTGVALASAEGSFSFSSSSSPHHQAVEPVPTVALAAELPYQEGWNAAARCWDGVWQQPVLQAKQRLLRFQHRQQTRSPAAVAMEAVMQQGAACRQVLHAIQAAQDTDALLRAVQGYGHYFGKFPELPAAVLQQAAQVWSAAAGRDTGSLQRSAGRRAALDIAGRSGAAGAAGPFTAVSSDGQPQSDGTIQQQPISLAALQQGLQLGASAPDAASGSPAASEVYESMVRWYTEAKQQPYDLLQRAKVSPSAQPIGSSSDAQQAGGTHKAECLLQLLSLGVSFRGTVLPTRTSLMPLLQQLQPLGVLQTLPEASVAQLCQQLLSREAGLQNWAAPEQQAAFSLMLSGVQMMQPPALLQLLHVLTQQQHLRQMQTEPAKLYRAGVERLVKLSKLWPMHAEFAQAAPQLLEVAQQACLAATHMIRKAHDLGHVLPGSEYFAQFDHGPPGRHHMGASGYRQWDQDQHSNFLQSFNQWRQHPAGTPSIAAEVVKATASGHLQQIAGVLQHVLPAQSSQQLDPAQAAKLLQLLACSRQFLGYNREQDALTVAAVVGGNAAGLTSADAAIEGLPDAVAVWLARDADGRAPMQQLSPITATATIWAALQLQLQPSHVPAMLDSICKKEPQQPAQQATGSDAESADLRAPARLVSSWPLVDLYHLLEALHWHDTKTPFCLQQRQIDAIAAAAAERIHQYAAHATAYASGKTASASSVSWRSRSSAAGSVDGLALSSGSAKSAVYARSSHISSIAHILKMRDQYHPAFLEAMQELVVAAALVRSSKTLKGYRPQILGKLAFKRILYTLASFDTCSPEGARAIRQLVSALLPLYNQACVARIAWSLAALDVRDKAVWTQLRQAILRNTGQAGAVPRVSKKARSSHAAAGDGAAAAAGEQEEEEEAAEGGDEADSALDAAPEQAAMPDMVALRELHLAKVFAQHCVLLAEPLLTDRVARLAVDAVAHISCNVTTSQMQRDVGHVLGELHAGSKESVLLSYQQEEKTGLGSVDIVVRVKTQWGPQSVAIEVDGPLHYAVNRSTKALGGTVLRDRLLKAQGFKLLTLPYFELQEQRKKGKAAAAWMEQLLRKASSTPPVQRSTSTD